MAINLLSVKKLPAGWTLGKWENLRGKAIKDVIISDDINRIEILLEDGSCFGVAGMDYEKGETGTAGVVGFFLENAQVDTRDLSRCVPRLVRAESDDQTRLSQSSNPVNYEIPLPIYNDEKPFSCGGVIKLSSIAQLFMDYEPDWENKLRNYLTEAQNRGLINEDEIDIIYPPSSTSSCADETEQTISSTNVDVDTPASAGCVPRLVRLFGFLFGACCWIGFPLILLGLPTVYLFGMSGGNWFTWSFYALSWVVALVWWFLCFRWGPTREFIETYL